MEGSPGQCICSRGQNQLHQLHARRDENGMEVMDPDDKHDEQKDVEEIILSKDSGRGDSGNAQDLLSSPPVMLIPIVETRPPTFLVSRRHSQIQLQIPDTTGNKERAASKSPATSTVSLTLKKGNSEFNTPIPFPSSSSPSRDGNQSQSLPNILTISKKHNDLRPASPAPSKKFVSSSPPLPILSTWEHTFNLAPRNVVPVKPQRYLEDQTVGGQLLEKTMKFVSGMFNRDGCNESPESDRQIKGKGKVIDRDRELGRQLKKWEEERFKEFGKKLPKAWLIEEAGLDTDTASMTPIPIFGFSSPEPAKKGWGRRKRSR